MCLTWCNHKWCVSQTSQSQSQGQLQQLLQQQQLQQLQQQMGIQIPGMSAGGDGNSPTLAQQLTQLGHDDMSKLRKSTNGSGGDKVAAGSSGDSEGKDKKDVEAVFDLESTLAQMSGVLEEAKEFLKQQKKPFGGEGSAKRALVPVNEQDDQDMNWISADEFSGAGKSKPILPPQVTADKKILGEFNTFKSVFGSRGLPFTLLSTEYMPAPSDKQPTPLEVTDKDLKFMVLLLMQETLYAGMLQDWEHSLGGSSSLKLLQETLSILLVAQDLSQSDLKTILRVKESGMSEAWKRIWGTLHESLGCPSKNLLSFLHAALRLAVERRYILLLSEHREEESMQRAQSMVAKAGQPFARELGGDWAKLRFCLSRTLASLEEGFVLEHPSKQELPTGVIKSCIIIARFLGDNGQFRDADVLFDRARVLAIKGGNKHFCAEVSLYCAELLNKWSASDPAYSVDTMARSAEYASQAAQLYESIDIQGDIPTMEKFSQVDILMNHLATEFSINHICRAEF